jgi:hypothetical protein
MTSLGIDIAAGLLGYFAFACLVGRRLRRNSTPRESRRV